MLWIAVCDDEVMECSKTATKIRGILEEMKVPCTIRQFYSGRELLRSPETFDIIFLDIIMGGMDGMRTAQLVRKKAYDKLLIFISASRDYVFDAYDVEAFQYLVKPIADKKLKRVLQGKGFFRCHKSYLVNLGYVDVYNRQELALDNGERIAIARRRYEAFCEEILKYMRRMV